MHHPTKFHQCPQMVAEIGRTAFNVFQNGSRPPSWIFRNLNF